MKNLNNGIYYDGNQKVILKDNEARLENGTLVGSVLKIKPIIGFVEGKVKSLAKTRSLKSGMEHIINALKELKCDPDYDIIASYTYDKTNLEKLVDMTDEVYKKQIRVYDNLDPAIACHWGPNAFGYIFVSRA